MSYFDIDFNIKQEPELQITDCYYGMTCETEEDALTASENDILCEIINENVITVNNRNNIKCDIEMKENMIPKSNKRNMDKNKNKAKEIRCIYCDNQFYSDVHLQLHLKSKTCFQTTYMQPYSCSDCARQFATLPSLAKHKQFVHYTKRKHVCTICPKGFLRTIDLTEHQRTHVNDRRHKCPECTKTFVRLSNMRQHQKTHSNEKQYKCSTCSNSFLRRSDWRRHLALHRSDQPKHQCKICQKSYTRSSNLKIHLNIHTAERVYECFMCQEQFFYSIKLRHHMYTHGNALVCKFCSKKFNAYETLKQHIRMHGGTAKDIN